MIDSFPEWADALTFYLGLILAIVGAAATAFSRYRKKLDRQREQYIKDLEDKIVNMENAYHETKGQVQMLAMQVMGRCPRFELDAVTNGCVHCTFGLLYGKNAEEEKG